MKALGTVLAVVALALLAVPAAEAQATRTWVSGVGDDANPCSRTAPCKTFAGAISKTAAGGEISVLDPGGFGAVTITKSITINGEGTLGGILASVVNGVIVNAGVNDKVVLRNISIHAPNNGLNGVRFLAGRHLILDNVTISGFTTRGVDVALANNGDFLIRNSRINNCVTGVRATTTSGLALGTIENTTFQGQSTGIDVAGNARVNVHDSVITGHTLNGVIASVGSAVVNIEGTLVGFNSGTGINASVSGSTIRVSNSEIYNNTTGIAIAGGATVASSGDNRVAGNGASAAPNAAIPLQ
jgi:hypothetical protein